MEIYLHSSDRLYEIVLNYTVLYTNTRKGRRTEGLVLSFRYETKSYTHTHTTEVTRGSRDVRRGLHMDTADITCQQGSNYTANWPWPTHAMSHVWTTHTEFQVSISQRRDHAKVSFATAKLLLSASRPVIHSSMVLRPLCLALASFCSFVILHTVGRTPWTRNQPVTRPLPTHVTAQTE
jgi:hypothetical protein